MQHESASSDLSGGLVSNILPYRSPGNLYWLFQSDIQVPKASMPELIGKSMCIVNDSFSFDASVDGGLGARSIPPKYLATWLPKQWRPYFGVNL